MQERFELHAGVPFSFSHLRPVTIVLVVSIVQLGTSQFDLKNTDCRKFFSLSDHCNDYSRIDSTSANRVSRGRALNHQGPCMQFGNYAIAFVEAIVLR